MSDISRIRIDENTYNIKDNAASRIIFKEASGSSATINDAIPAPVVDLTVAIEPVQAGSGEPRPTNIRPITGRTGCNVTRTGKNLLDISKAKATGTGTTLTISNNTIRVQNSSGTRYTGFRMDYSEDWNLPKVSALTCSFTVTGVNTNEDFVIGLRTNPGNGFISGHTMTFKANGTYSFSFDMTDLTTDWYFSMSRTSNHTDDIDITFTNLQIEIGSEATVYEPYHDTAYPISFGSAGTVYGGLLDVTTGVLTVTHGLLEVQNLETVSSANWAKSTSENNRFYISKVGMNRITPITASLRCSHFESKDNNTSTYGIYHDNNNNGGTFFIMCDSAVCGSTVEDFRQWLATQKTAGTPVQLWYELITPLTYQLTPTEVSILLGVNTVSANTGDVTLTYCKNTDSGTALGKALENISITNTQTRTMLTQSSEISMTASKNYNIGDLMIIGSKLLRATANIISGGTITIGTNAEEIDLESVIKTKAEKTLTFPLANNAGAHNSIYRGASLGTAVTIAQWNAISAGTFTDMYIGDYWTINGIIWRIAAFDYWYNTGDANNVCQTHHVVIVPGPLTSAQMNSTGTVEGAYVGSDFYTKNNSNTGKNEAQNAVVSAFGNHILTKREYFANAVTDGIETGGDWYDSTVDLMNEQMVFGSDFYHNLLGGSANKDSHTIDNSQLPLFRLDHSKIRMSATWWLRDVSSAGRFSLISSTGYTGSGGANGTWSIRPVFGIKA